MKKSCVISAIVLIASIALTSCGSSTSNDAPAQTGSAGNALQTESDNDSAQNETAQTANGLPDYDDGGKTAPNPLTISVSNGERGSIDGQLTWYFNGNGVTIDSCMTSETEVIIPPTIKVNGVDEKVTAIAEKVFASYPLESIIVPDSVVFIGKDAFSDTPWLNNQPDGPLYIGKVLYGFVGSQPTGEFEIKDGTKTIGNSAFEKSINLTSVKIPSSVTTIEDNAFAGCTGLTSMEIPDSVTVIGSGAFKDCKNLASVALPKNMTSIGGGAFKGCNNLTSITAPENISNFTSVPFDGTPWYREWWENQPDGPIYMGTVLYDYKFTSYDEPITEFMVRDGTTKISMIADFNTWQIDPYAFSPSMSVTIPDSVNEIDTDWYFMLDRFMFWWENQPDGPVYFGKVFLGYRGDMPANTSLEIKEGTVAIVGGALDGFSTLTSVTLPGTVKTIGYGAFSGCSALTSVNIPDGVTTIGGSAFSGTALTSVDIPDSVTIIGGSAFSGCESLTSVTIPNIATAVGNNAFSGAENLTITAPFGSSAQAYTLRANSNVEFEGL